jgi:SAM-dependent methyltransferase
MDRVALEEAVKKLWWYHSIDLGNGVVTPGQAVFQRNLEIVLPLLHGVDVTNRSCLDVGTMDGKIAFELERRGGKVVATDLIDRDTVRFIRRHLQSSIQYLPGISIDVITDRLLELYPERFEVVTCAGVLYHIYSPLHAIISLRRLLRPGGVLLLESGGVPERGVSMSFNDRGRFYDDPTTFWLPTAGGIQYMLRFACFQPLQAACFVESAGSCRYAVVARAMKPSAMVSLDDWLGTIHHQPPGFLHQFLAPLDLAELEGQLETPEVRVKVDSCAEENRLDPSLWQVWTARLRRFRQRFRMARKPLSFRAWDHLTANVKDSSLDS